MLIENTQNPPYLHVKHKNTRKTDKLIKMVEDTLFSHIDKILKVVPRLDEYIWFPFFQVPEPSLWSYMHTVLVSSRKVTKPTVCVIQFCMYP